MKIDESNRTVTVSKVEMHRGMMDIFDRVTAGYTVIVTAYGKPVAHITNAKKVWNGIQMEDDNATGTN